jgi:hypothetical protein
MPVGNLVFWAWHKHQLVQLACEHTRGKPGATESVVVARHTLTSVHRPRVQLEAAGQTYPIVDLVLSVTLLIESLVVTVEAGRVLGWGAGNASSSATLGVARPGGGDPYPIARKELRLVTLPSYGAVTEAATPTTRTARVANSPVQRPPAGWYGDPALRHQVRYWDGGAWTDHVADQGVQLLDRL